MMKSIWVFLIAFMLMGCSIPSQGGLANISDQTVTKTTHPDGSTTTKQNTITTQVKQPDNPKDSATISVSKGLDGAYNTTISTGKGYNVAHINAAIKSLSPVMYAGVFLCVAGGLVLVFTKMTMLKWGLGLFGVGLTMITVAYLIPTYSFVFLLGFLALLGFIGYISWKSFTSKKALAEVVTTTQYLKNNYMTSTERDKEFNSKNGIVALTQKTKTTPKLVQEVKEKSI